LGLSLQATLIGGSARISLLSLSGLREAWVNFGLRVLILRRVRKFVVVRDYFCLDRHWLLPGFLHLFTLFLTLGLEHGYMSEFASLTILEQRP